jgi:hypothetical protein
VPKEIDETAYIDGYSFPRFFVKIFIPLIRAGIGVTAFFCFMFSWVELLLARTLTTTVAKPIAATMTRTVSASGIDWGLLAAAGMLTIVPGALVIWFVRNSHLPRALPWAGSEEERHGYRMDGLDACHGRLFHLHRAHAHRHDRVADHVPEHRPRGAFCPSSPPGETVCSSAFWAAPTSIWPGWA